MSDHGFVVDSNVGFPVISQARDRETSPLDWADGLLDRQEGDPTDETDQTIDQIIGKESGYGLDSELEARLALLPPEIRERILRTLHAPEHPKLDAQLEVPPTVSSEMLRLERLQAEMLKPKREDKDDEDELPEEFKRMIKKPKKPCKACMGLGYTVVADRAGTRHQIACSSCSNRETAGLLDQIKKLEAEISLLSDGRRLAAIENPQIQQKLQQIQQLNEEVSRLRGMSNQDPTSKFQGANYYGQQFNSNPLATLKNTNWSRDYGAPAQNAGQAVQMGAQQYQTYGQNPGEAAQLSTQTGVSYTKAKDGTTVPEADYKRGWAAGVQMKPKVRAINVPGMAPVNNQMNAAVPPPGETAGYQEGWKDAMASEHPRFVRIGSNLRTEASKDNSNHFIRTSQSGKRYHLGDIEILDMQTDPRYDNLGGYISIGGDNGDVQAAGVSPIENGVVLHGVILISSIPDLNPDEAEDMVNEIVRNSYDSIGPEAFAPVKEKVPPPPISMGRPKDPLYQNPSDAPTSDSRAWQDGSIIDNPIFAQRRAQRMDDPLERAMERYKIRNIMHGRGEPGHGPDDNTLSPEEIQGFMNRGEDPDGFIEVRPGKWRRRNDRADDREYSRSLMGDGTPTDAVRQIIERLEDREASSNPRLAQLRGMRPGNWREQVSRGPIDWRQLDLKDEQRFCPSCQRKIDELMNKLMSGEITIPHEGDPHQAIVDLLERTDNLCPDCSNPQGPEDPSPDHEMLDSDDVRASSNPHRFTRLSGAFDYIRDSTSPEEPIGFNCSSCGEFLGNEDDVFNHWQRNRNHSHFTNAKGETLRQTNEGLLQPPKPRRPQGVGAIGRENRHHRDVERGNDTMNAASLRHRFPGDEADTRDLVDRLMDWLNEPKVRQPRTKQQPGMTPGGNLRLESASNPRFIRLAHCGSCPGDPCKKCHGSGEFIGGHFTKDNPGQCFDCGGTGKIPDKGLKNLEAMTRDAGLNDVLESIRTYLGRINDPRLQRSKLTELLQDTNLAQEIRQLLERRLQEQDGDLTRSAQIIDQSGSELEARDPGTPNDLSLHPGGSDVDRGSKFRCMTCGRWLFHNQQVREHWELHDEGHSLFTDRQGNIFHQTSEGLFPRPDPNDPKADHSHNQMMSEHASQEMEQQRDASNSHRFIRLAIDDDDIIQTEDFLPRANPKDKVPTPTPRHRNTEVKPDSAAIGRLQQGRDRKREYGRKQGWEELTQQFTDPHSNAEKIAPILPDLKLYFDTNRAARDRAALEIANQTSRGQIPYPDARDKMRAIGDKLGLAYNGTVLASNSQRFVKLAGDGELITQCSWCNAIKDPKTDRWEPSPRKLHSLGEMSVSHGICPECKTKVLQREMPHQADSNPQETRTAGANSRPEVPGDVIDKLSTLLNNSRDENLDRHIHAIRSFGLTPVRNPLGLWTILTEHPTRLAQVDPIEPGGHTPSQDGLRPLYQDDDTLVLQDGQSGELRLFQKGEGYSPGSINIGGRTYEFVRSIDPQELLPTSGIRPPDWDRVPKPDELNDLPNTDQLTSDMDLRRQLQLDQGSVDPRALDEFQRAPINLPTAHTGRDQDRRLREPWAGSNDRFVRLAMTREAQDMALPLMMMMQAQNPDVLKANEMIKKDPNASIMDRFQANWMPQNYIKGHQPTTTTHNLNVTSPQMQTMMDVARYSNENDPGMIARPGAAPNPYDAYRQEQRRMYDAIAASSIANDGIDPRWAQQAIQQMTTQRDALQQQLMMKQMYQRGSEENLPGMSPTQGGPPLSLERGQRIRQNQWTPDGIRPTWARPGQHWMRTPDGSAVELGGPHIDADPMTGEVPFDPKIWQDMQHLVD